MLVLGSRYPHTHDATGPVEPKEGMYLPGRTGYPAQPVHRLAAKKSHPLELIPDQKGPPALPQQMATRLGEGGALVARS